MIQMYNQHQPDFGLKIEERKDEWIDPNEIINNASSRPFQIKTNKTRIYKGVASGQNAYSNNRNKLEEDRRQMLQFNMQGNNLNTRLNQNMEEEKKVNSRKPPRISSSSNKTRHKPKTLRSNNINYSAARDGSFTDHERMPTHSYKPYKRKTNRTNAPCPVRIPKEVTDGIALLKSIRQAAEGSTNNTTYMSSQLEESRSPNEAIHQRNVISQI
jgi:hypothetical protein